ncbi:hypothetical protein [Rhizobium halophytocola]|uniref:Glycosyltransferase n=1 Tax=Rhizobium halophytocola TaxID=735519 RepID=A0ABS4E1V1_9HYPH|nr:hypothetical protein [Rhizobium halophytocola]MBP1851919.1 hypothetical protein [Rhizobium halophytocola]
MSLVSIFMPSNRPFASSRVAIESAIVYAEKTGGRLIVSDNSGDPEKLAVFGNASDHMLYLHSPGASPADNFLRALAKVETPFVMPMGDDDEIFLLDDKPRIDLSMLDDDIVGLRPTTVVWTVENGIVATNQFQIRAATADQRINEYRRLAPGNNALYYATFRTATYKALFEPFYTLHPTRGGYCDWSLVFALVACGRIPHDPATVFRYNLGRWSSPESIRDTTQSLFTAVGLPPEAMHYARLMRFVDTHCLLSSRHLPLQPDQRQQAIALHGRTTMQSFRAQVTQEPQRFSAEARALAGAPESFDDMQAVFERSLTVLDGLKPDLSTLYRDYYQALAGT